MSATILDLAHATGISKSTVARALSGDPHCAAATRRRVEEAAARLGYRPHPVHARLGSLRGAERRTAAQPVIACILPRRPGPSTTDGQPGDLAHMPVRLRARAEALGYGIDAFVLPEVGDSATLQRILLARGLRAVLVAGVFPRGHAFNADWSRFVALALEPGGEPTPLDAVTTDKFAAVELAWEHMRAAGYRRLGAVFLRHAEPVRDDDLRRAAVFACQAREPGLPTLPVLEYVVGSSGLDASLRTYLREHRPDAILGFSGFIEWRLRELGLRIPHDLAFATLHHEPHESTLAGVPHSHGLAAEAAVDLLHQAIRTNHWGVRPARIVHLVEPEWRDGLSLPPAGTASAAAS